MRFPDGRSAVPADGGDAVQEVHNLLKIPHNGEGIDRRQILQGDTVSLRNLLHAYDRPADVIL